MQSSTCLYEANLKGHLKNRKEELGSSVYLAVCHPMIIKVRGSGEAFPANVALVRFFSTVDAPMCVKRARRGEPFSANVADVRLLSGVCAHVPADEHERNKLLLTN